MEDSVLGDSGKVEGREEAREKVLGEEGWVRVSKLLQRGREQSVGN